MFFKSSKNKHFFLQYVKWFWILFGTFILGITLVFVLASWGVFGKMPTFKHLENPQTNLASEIISFDGETLGKFYLDDNRTPVAYEELPSHLIEALVSTEDERFYDHSGIDARSTIRAVAYMGKRGGASTISQQLAKQLFTAKVSNNIFARIVQKIKEWVIAVRLEKQYTKEEIISMYFNIYDFNYNADGIRSAARIYFGKEPSQLKIEESAMLVGMLKNSSLYNPKRRVKLVKERRDVVLAQMFRNDFIIEQTKDSLQKLPLKINFQPESHREGLATYFRMQLQSFLNHWIANNLKEDGDKYNIYLDGLKIYTTIDSRMQANAEAAVDEHMKRLQAEFFVQNTPERNKTAPFTDLTEKEIESTYERAMKRSERWRHLEKDLGKSEKEIRASFNVPAEMSIFSWSGEKDTVMTPRDSIKHHKFYLRASLLSMEPQTGHIKAWVGGINFKHFQYDQVAKGARQIGSTFKPFVYAAALDQLRLSPCDSLPDVLHCIEAGKYGNPDVWCPKNSSAGYTGEMMTLKHALANSVNTITARLIDQIGPGPVIELARKLGIKSDIPNVPSIALGTPDLTLYEMVGAYGTFANEGVYVKPVFVTRIEDKNGMILYQSSPETKDVLSKEVAYTAVNLMQGVTQTGSGTRLRHQYAAKSNPVFKEIITGYPYKFTNPIAGKTGTTQNQSDGWFMGMVPNLATGVWVGGEDRAIHFRTLTYGQGASMALPIWALYMKSCYDDESIGISNEDFEEPENLNIRTRCDQKQKEDEGYEDEDQREFIDDLQL